MSDKRDFEIVPGIGIPDKMKREGLARAPYTISGFTGCAIVGGALFGPPGALVGGIIGGFIGYAKDEGVTKEDIKREFWEEY